MGGRIASLVADETKVAGLVCLGYPSGRETVCGKVPCVYNGGC